MAPEHVLGYQDWLNWFINKQTVIQNQISSTAEKNITENSQITGGNKKNDEKENKKVSNKRTRES